MSETPNKSFKFVPGLRPSTGIKMLRIFMPLNSNVRRIDGGRCPRDACL